MSIVRRETEISVVIGQEPPEASATAVIARHQRRKRSDEPEMSAPAGLFVYVRFHTLILVKAWLLFICISASPHTVRQTGVKATPAIVRQYRPRPVITTMGEHPIR
jgi:hypothetical protein